MQEIKDEILEGEARYRITDNNGNIIQDNVNIEQITPVLQEGTPINKALFDNIGGEIENSLNIVNNSIENNAIYKTPYGESNGGVVNMTLTDVSVKEYALNRELLINAPKVSERFNSRCQLAIAEDGFQAPAYFNDGKNTSSSSGFTSASVGTQYAYALSKPIKPYYITVQFYDGSDSTYKHYYATSFQIWVSNDGSSWSVLAEISKNSAGSHSFAVSAPVYCKYISITFTGNNDGNPIWFYGLAVTQYETVLDYIPMGSTININNLGAKTITSPLITDNKYQLVYNGTSWDIWNANKLAEQVPNKINRSNFKQGTTTMSVRTVGTTSVTFDTAFSNIPTVMAIGNLSTSDNPEWCSVITINSVSTTGFSYSASLPSASYPSSTRLITVYWIAIDTIS